MNKSNNKIVPFPVYFEPYLKPYVIGSRIQETLEPTTAVKKHQEATGNSNLTPEETIRQLMEIYQKLCVSCNEINKIFQFQILGFSLNSLHGIVFFIYYVLIFESTNLSYEMIDYIMPYLWAQVIGCILDMTAIVTSCSYAKRSVS